MNKSTECLALETRAKFLADALNTLEARGQTLEIVPTIQGVLQKVREVTAQLCWEAAHPIADRFGGPVSTEVQQAILAVAKDPTPVKHCEHITLYGRYWYYADPSARPCDQRLISGDAKRCDQCGEPLPPR